MPRDTTFGDARPPKGESPYLTDTDKDSVPSAEAPDRRRAEDGNHQGMPPTSYPSVAREETPRALGEDTARQLRPVSMAPSLAGTKRRKVDASVVPVADNRGEAKAPNLAEHHVADSASITMKAQVAVCTDDGKDTSPNLCANVNQHLFFTSHPTVTRSQVLRALHRGNTAYLLQIRADLPTPSTRAYLRTIDLGIGGEDKECSRPNKMQRWEHMGQLLLELGNIPEPRSSSPHLHAMGRKRLDPETRASLLAVTLLHRPPTMGTGLQGADSADLT